MLEDKSTLPKNYTQGDFPGNPLSQLNQAYQRGYKNGIKDGVKYLAIGGLVALTVVVVIGFFGLTGAAAKMKYDWNITGEKREALELARQKPSHLVTTATSLPITSTSSSR